MTSMLTSRRSSKPAASYGNLQPTFLACFASPSCPTLRALPLWSLLRNPAMPSPERPAPPTPGTIGWHELYTTDLEGGFEFYNKLFGWTKVSDMDMGPMGIYRIFDEGDHKQMGDGGMMTQSKCGASGSAGRASSTRGAVRHAAVDADQRERVVVVVVGRQVLRPVDAHVLPLVPGRSWSFSSMTLLCSPVWVVVALDVEVLGML